MIIDPDRHFFITSSRQIDEIIKPLKEFFKLSTFAYQKTFNDLSEIRLSNQAQWMRYFYENELYNHNIFERPPSEFKKDRVIWAGLSTFQPILEKARLFDIEYGITFVEPCSDGCEFFCFGTRVDQPENSLHYLSNLDALEHFINYFREQAALLLKEASRHKIIIPEKFAIAPSPTGFNSFDRAGFIQQMTAHKFTPRELDCMRLITRGFTHKMIAKELNISPRTVEDHLEHIKQKTQSDSKGDLVKYLLKLPAL